MAHNKHEQSGRILNFGQAWLAVYKGAGDHCFPVVEFDSKALLGKNVLKVVSPPARRLACSIPKTLKNYRKRLMSHVAQNKLPEKL